MAKTTEEIKELYIMHKYSDEALALIDDESNASLHKYRLGWAGFLEGYRTAEAESHAEIAEILTSHDEEQERANKAEARVKVLEKALRIAQEFCNHLTADECPDQVAIPINEVLKDTP